MKLLLIILIGSLVIAIGYYFISPYIKIFNGIHVELNELVNKYFVSDDSNGKLNFNFEALKKAKEGTITPFSIKELNTEHWSEIYNKSKVISFK